MFIAYVHGKSKFNKIQMLRLYWMINEHEGKKGQTWPLLTGFAMNVPPDHPLEYQERTAPWQFFGTFLGWWSVTPSKVKWPPTWRQQGHFEPPGWNVSLISLALNYVNMFFFRIIHRSEIGKDHINDPSAKISRTSNSLGGGRVQISRIAISWSSEVDSLPNLWLWYEYQHDFWSGCFNFWSINKNINNKNWMLCTPGVTSVPLN